MKEKDWIENWLKTIPKEDRVLGFSEVIGRLVKLEKLEEASQILLNFSFVEEKLRKFKTLTLIDEYKIVLKNSHSKNLQKLLSVIEQSSHLLDDKKNSIPTILYGYLDGNFSESIKYFKSQIMNKTKDTWLKSENANFVNQQGNLIKLIKAHKTDISTMEISIDNKIIFTGTYNGEIKVWNTKNYLETAKTKTDGMLRRFYDLENRKFLTVSENQDDIILRSMSFNSKGIEIISDLKLEDKSHNITKEELHQIEISEDKNWLLMHNPEKTNHLTVRSTNDLSNKFDISLSKEIGGNGKILGFNFIEEYNQSPPRIICLYTAKRETGNLVIFENKTTYRVIKKAKITNCFEGNIIIREKQNILFFWNSSGYIQKTKIDTLELVKDIRVILEEDLNEVYLDGVFFTKNNENVIVFTSDGKIKWWNIDENICFREEEGDTFTDVFEIQKGEIGYTTNGVYDLRIWDLKNGEILNTLKNISVETVFRLKNKRYGITVDYENLLLWDVKFERELKIENFNSGVTTLKLSKFEENIYYAGDYDGFIKKIIINQGKIEVEECLNLENEISDIIFINWKNKPCIVIATGDMFEQSKTISIYDIKSLRKIKTLNGHEAHITKIISTLDEQYLISIGNDFKTIIWKLQEDGNNTHSSIQSNYKNEKPVGFDVFLIEDTKKLITVSLSAIEFRNFNSRKLIKVLHTESAIADVSITKDKKTLAYALGNGTVFFKELDDLEKNIGELLVSSFIKKIEFVTLKGNTQLFCSTKKSIVVLSLKERKVIQTYSYEIKENINDFLFIPKENYLFVITQGGELLIWNTQNERLIKKLVLGRPFVRIKYNIENRILVLTEMNGQIHFLKIQNKPNKTK